MSEFTLEKLQKEVIDEYSKRLDVINRNGVQYDALLKALPDEGIVHAWIDSELNITASGDKHLLLALIRLFRAKGFSAHNKPEEKSTSYYAHFYHENGCQFWLAFSSTSCRRVKVGTKMVEQDVYETVCDEFIPPAVASTGT